MYIEPTNPIIKKTLSDFLQKELEYSETAFDYDGVQYMVSGHPEQSEVRFSMKCLCPKQIFENGGDEMIDQCYKEFALPKSEYDPDYDVTIRISTAGMPKTQKVKKSMDDETAA